MPRYLAVVGTRNWSAFAPLSQITRRLDAVHAIHPDLVIVSGAGGDVGLCAARWARANGVRCIEYLPEFERYGRAGGPRRNSFIVARCDAMLAFWNGGRGTQDSVTKAQAASKRVTAVRPDGTSKRVG